MWIKAAGLAALFVGFGSSFAAAGPAIDAATKAEALAAEGKVGEALDALNAAIDALCQASPLSFRKTMIVDSAIAESEHKERTDKSFKPDEKLSVYVEPVCFGHAAGGDIGFKADLSIENGTGQVLTEAKDVFSVSTPATAARRDFSMTLSFGVPFVRPGDYKALFTVRDQNSDKSGTFEVPFTVTLPTAN